MIKHAWNAVSRLTAGHTVPSTDQHPPHLRCMLPAAFGASCASSPLPCWHHAWWSPRTDPPPCLTIGPWASVARPSQVPGIGQVRGHQILGTRHWIPQRDGPSWRTYHAGAYPHHLWPCVDLFLNKVYELNHFQKSSSIEFTDQHRLKRQTQQYHLDCRSGNIPGWIISPGLDLIRSCLPSRWVRMNWNPHKASVREIVCSMNRSSYFLLNLGCSLTCKTKTMSPVTVSGCKNMDIILQN